jgi:ABC-2 type transport system ATP-binding protein
MQPAIKTEKLSKHYGNLKAADEVSINVEKGEIYGFLGLNGAGKTTTIKMLLGLINPTSGEAFLNGKKVNAGDSKLWSNVGYLVEVPYSYPDLTVKENLDIFRLLRQIKSSNPVHQVISLLKLEQYKNVKAKNLSLGNSQRLGLARAMIHEPEILILDEPANGLDPAGIVEIRELLVDMAVNKGVTIFISSHILGEISKFATRIGIIHNGRMLHESSADEMVNQRKVCLKIKVNNILEAKRLLEGNGFDSIISEEYTLEILQTEAIANPGKIATLLVQGSMPPYLLKVEEEDLETFFLRVISMKGGIE